MLKNDTWQTRLMFRSRTVLQMEQTFIWNIGYCVYGWCSGACVTLVTRLATRGRDLCRSPVSANPYGEPIICAGLSTDSDLSLSAGLPNQIEASVALSPSGIRDSLMSSLVWGETALRHLPVKPPHVIKIHCSSRFALACLWMDG